MLHASRTSQVFSTTRGDVFALVTGFLHKHSHSWDTWVQMVKESVRKTPKLYTELQSKEYVLTYGLLQHPSHQTIISVNDQKQEMTDTLTRQLSAYVTVACMTEQQRLDLMRVLTQAQFQPQLLNENQQRLKDLALTLAKLSYPRAAEEFTRGTNRATFFYMFTTVQSKFQTHFNTHNTNS